MTLHVRFEWAGHYLHLEDNHDKIWTGAAVDDSGGGGIFLAAWGRRDTKYQQQAKPFSSYGRAYDHLQAKIAAKIDPRNYGYRGAYHAVAFNDPDHGNIPSFTAGDVQSTVLVPAALAPPYEITPAALISRFKSICKRLVAVVHHSALASLAMELTELDLLCGLLTSLRTGPEIDALVSARIQAQQTLGAVIKGLRVQRA